MLSVKNRGSIVGSDNDGLFYKIVDGYSYGSYQGKPLEIIKIANTSKPSLINIEPIIKQGYENIPELIKLGNPQYLNIPITPIIKSGYTPITEE